MVLSASKVRRLRGLTLRNNGELEAAESVHRESLRLAASQEDVAVAYSDLGTVAYRRGRPARALRYFARSLVLSRRLAMTNAEACAMSNIGRVLGRLGSYERAEFYLREGLRVACRDKLTDLAPFYGNLGIVLFQRHRHREATSMLRRALALERKRERHLGVGRCLSYFGRISLRRQLMRRAAVFFEAASASYERASAARPLIAAFGRWGYAYERLGEVETAETLYRRSLTAATRASDIRGRAIALERLARICDGTGDSRRAARLRRLAARIAAT